MGDDIKVHKKFLAKKVLGLAAEHYHVKAYNYGEAVGEDARAKATVSACEQLEKDDIGLCPRTSSARTEAQYKADRLLHARKELDVAKELIDFVHEVFAEHLEFKDASL